MVTKNKKEHWANTKIRKNKYSKKTILRLLFYFLFLAFVTMVVYFFLFSNFLKINSVFVSGCDDVLSEEITKTIREDLSGKYFEFISKNNFLFFNEKKTKEELKNKFKKIEQIKIEKKFPDKIIANVIEKNKILIICSGGKCFFVDKNGVAYNKVTLKSKEMNRDEFIELIDESNQLIKENEKVLSASFVSFLLNASSVFKGYLGIDLRNEYRTKSCVSEEVVAQTKSGWDILLSSKIPLKKSAQTLKVVFDKQITLKEFNQLEYVDLRLENKVFYRLKGAVVEERESDKIGEKKNSDQQN